MCHCFIFPLYGNLLFSYLPVTGTYWDLGTHTKQLEWNMDFSPSPYIFTMTVRQGLTFKIDYNPEDEYIITKLVHI